MVSKEQVGSIENLVRTLNPAAKILRTTYSKVDLKELLSTPSVFLSR
jgi:G3E family GTPase